ncbi:MAG TPA: YigZ family protein [Thermoanaerobaculia bacterium]|jgi:uncharacterized YigZ family protein
MQSDHYLALASPAEFRLKVERSDFLGLAFPCASDDEFFAVLQRVEKQYFDATHHCWAFRIFADQASGLGPRASDAGEPHGSAGKPILSAIEGAQLFDTGLVVVRWFGGVKLGTGGLSRAYRETAAETLRAANIVERLLYDTYDIEVPFDSVSVIYRLLDPPHIVRKGEAFGETNVFTVDVRRSRASEIEKTLTDRRLTFSRATTPR